MKEIGDVYSVKILDAEGEPWEKHYFMGSSTKEALDMAETWIDEAFPNSGLVIGDVNLVAVGVLDVLVDHERRATRGDLE